MLGDAGITIKNSVPAYILMKSTINAFGFMCHRFLLPLDIEFHTFTKQLSAIMCISDF